jgi:hypothetical protein
MNDNNSNAKKPKGFRNLPGLQVAHVVKEDKSDIITPPREPQA